MEDGPERNGEPDSVAGPAARDSRGRVEDVVPQPFRRQESACPLAVCCQLSPLAMLLG